jgi:hypothetical protein
MARSLDSTRRESRRAPHNTLHWLAVSGLLALTAILAYITIRVALQQSPNRSTVAMLQVVTLLLSIGTSIYAGRQSALKSAQELLRPHAKSAYRRTLSLSVLNRRFSQKLDEYDQRLDDLADPNTGAISATHVHMSVDLFRVMAADLATTIGDALWDWKDILPEELEQLEALSKESQPKDVEFGEP